MQLPDIQDARRDRGEDGFVKLFDRNSGESIAEECSIINGRSIVSASPCFCTTLR